MATTLLGTTLADPYEYHVAEGIRGSDSVMADGSMYTDLVSDSTKRTFNLRWRAISAAQLTVITGVYQAIKNTSGTLVAPDGGTFTVTREEGGRLQYNMIQGGDGNVYWNVNADFREV